MNVNIKYFISLFFLLVFSPLAWGDLTGLWQEYDDDTGKLAALIRIDKRPDNVYEGVVEKVFLNAGETSDQLCTRCRGDLHNHTLLGLPILTDMKRKDRTHYEGGQILDPDDGKIYRCRIQLDEDENTLQVTGFNNFSWIGQSEIWRRAK
jgi:uncharacterized protein (DUF2147 family)